MEKLKEQVRNGKINSWQALHKVYLKEGEQYEACRQMHGLAVLCELEQIKNLKKITRPQVQKWLTELLEIEVSLTEKIFLSREKDYTNPFRKMVYDTDNEMNEVLGKLEDNSFIRQENERLSTYRKNINRLKRLWK